MFACPTALLIALKQTLYNLRFEMRELNDIHKRSKSIIIEFMVYKYSFIKVRQIRNSVASFTLMVCTVRVCAKQWVLLRAQKYRYVQGKKTVPKVECIMVQGFLQFVSKSFAVSVVLLYNYTCSRKLIMQTLKHRRRVALALVGFVSYRLLCVAG